MIPNRIVFALILAGATFCTAAAQPQMTREQYIDKYKNLALEQMDIYGIPASIKLAQAML